MMMVRAGGGQLRKGEEMGVCVRVCGWNGLRWTQSDIQLPPCLLPLSLSSLSLPLLLLLLLDSAHLQTYRQIKYPPSSLPWSLQPMPPSIHVNRNIETLHSLFVCILNNHDESDANVWKRKAREAWNLKGGRGPNYGGREEQRTVCGLLPSDFWWLSEWVVDVIIGFLLADSDEPKTSMNDIS